MNRQCEGDPTCGGYADYQVERRGNRTRTDLPPSSKICLDCLHAELEESVLGESVLVTVLYSGSRTVWRRD